MDCQNEAFHARISLIEAGWDDLSSGSYRYVLRHPSSRCVVKVARDRGSTRSNRRERRFWRHVADRPQARFFVPVIGRGPRDAWITMGLVEEAHAWGREADELEEAMALEGASCEDVSESNVGWHDGTLKIMDYGEGAQCRLS
jgi:hypothetical protein